MSFAHLTVRTRLLIAFGALLAPHLDVQARMAEVVGRYAVGDFAPDMPALPGEQAWLNQAMSEVKANLVAVQDEIAMLSSAAAAGGRHQAAGG